MSRYDSHVSRLKRQVEDLAESVAEKNFASALRVYSTTGELPENKRLGEKILTWKAHIENACLPVPPLFEEYKKLTTLEREPFRLLNSLEDKLEFLKERKKKKCQ